MNVETVNRIKVIRTKKFKTIKVQLRFFEPLSEETASARALMLAMMRAKTEDQPSRRKLQNHLENLYDTQLSTRASKLGSKHVAELSLRFVHPDYVSGRDGYLDSVMDTLQSVLERPLFDQSVLAEEKRFLKAHFASEYANKDVYASKRYQEHLFRDHPYRIPALGVPEGVDPVTLESISEAYESMRANPVFITVVGDVDDALLNVISKALETLSPSVPSDLLVRHELKAKESVLETLNLSQDRLFMTLKSDVYYTDEDVYAMRVLDAMLGGGSDSLLFESVREKHGMAYQVHSSYQPLTGLVMVMAGVSRANVEKTKTLIREARDTIRQGAFSDDALLIAKQSQKQAIKRSYDLQGALAAKALIHSVFETPIDKDTVLKKIDNVGKDDVIRLAKTLEFVFTYVLGGKNDA